MIFHIQLRMLCIYYVAIMLTFAILHQIVGGVFVGDVKSIILGNLLLIDEGALFFFCL